MPCTCNAICDNDCASNQLCTGHVATCVNTYSFSWTPVSGVTVILASHVDDLEAAINQEVSNTSRRFNASDPAYCSTHTPGDVACTTNSFSTSATNDPSIGDGISVDDFNDIKSVNNEVAGDSGFGELVVSNFIAQSVSAVNSVILASAILELQTKINATRNACICDSHCNCDPSDCGCNGECPNDDYYYYYYP